MTENAERSLLTLARTSLQFVLQLYAGCLFSGSAWTGALLLAASAFAPFAALLGLLAVASALFTAHTLRLLSDKNPAAVYTYSALFLGLIAPRTFADPLVAAALALLGAAASVLITAGLRDLGQRFGLPSLSLPFVGVYLCALGTGRVLGLGWAEPPPSSHAFAAHLPEFGREYLEALGAIVCDGRAEVGLLVLAALLVSSLHKTLLTTLGFVVALIVSYLLQLAPTLRLMMMLNAMFTALALGMSRYPRLWSAYGLAGLGALLCSLATPSLSAPLGKLTLTPLSLPFNLSFYAVLLVTRKLTQHAHNNEHASSRAATQPHSVIA